MPLENALIFYSSLHGYGIGLVVADGQRVLAVAADLNRLVDASIGDIQIIEQAVRGDVAEIETGGFGRVGTVILYDVPLGQ